MKEEKQPNHNKRNILLVILLAVLCIGAVELMACRHFAPDVYQEITAPVRRAVAAADGLRRSAVNQAAAFVRGVQNVWEQWQEERRLEALRREEERRLEEEQRRLEEEQALLESQLASQPKLESNFPPSDPSITELALEDSQVVLTGGNMSIVYFNQTDEVWADQPYGSDNIGKYGCGPTAMAMVVASMAGAETDPAVMSQWAVDHGYWCRRSGSYHTIVEGTAKAYGLNAKSFSERSSESLREALFSGKLLVALMGPGHFTSGGHFIILRGVTLSGEILVADPASVDRSLIAWDAQLLLDELSKSTSGGAPLWVVSTSEN